VQDALRAQAVEEYVFAKVGSLEGDVDAAARLPHRDEAKPHHVRSARSRAQLTDPHQK
jgi:hypothetical protein